jgi:hypothetical protein
LFLLSYFTIKFKNIRSLALNTVIELLAPDHW